DWQNGEALGDSTPPVKDGKVLVYYHPMLANISTIAPGSCLFSHVWGTIIFGFFLFFPAGSKLSGKGSPLYRKMMGTSVPQSGDDMFNQGLLHASEGRDKQAIDCFDKFIGFAAKAGPGVDGFRELN